MANLPKNTFYDINKFPSEKGLLVFGLSMTKLSNRQNADNCLKDIEYFSPSKIAMPLIGLNFLYADFLYLYENKPAPELKDSLMFRIINHKNSMQKLLHKSRLDFQIQHAFSYIVWNQLYVGTNDFAEKLSKIKEIYAKDQTFQKCIQQDCEKYGRTMQENQINFFLEEFLMCYLVSRGQVKLPNEYIENQQKWILFCYPGVVLKGMVYMYQLNPFDIDWSENPYQNCHYDLEAKKLIDFTRIDLETYNYQYA